MEWLISENYALGFMLTAMTTFTDFTLLFSLTANIVLGGEFNEKPGSMLSKSGTGHSDGPL